MDPYARIAPIYDPVVQPFMAQVRRETALQCLRNNLSNVLDMGCGTGRQCIVLHRHGLRATGVDSSPAMLQVARSQSPAQISYKCLDAASTGFPDCSFDAVNLCFALHENPPVTIQAMLREGKRLLRPNGMLFITDYLTPKPLTRRVVHLMIAGIERVAGREHYRNYRRFLCAGGVTKVPNSVLPMPASACRTFFLNCAALLSVRK